jgi:general secretion pathway protein F
MNDYLIASVDLNGSVVSTHQSARTESDALRLSEVDPSQMISIIKKSHRDFLAGGSRTMKRTEVLSYYEGLTQLLGSGLTLTTALAVNARQSQSHASLLAKSQLQSLSLGMSPSMALDQSHGGSLNLLTALVRAGERNGEIAQCIERFCQLERNAIVLRRRLVSASLYPLGMLFFSLMVILFLFIFVIPKFAVLIEGNAKVLPWPSRMVFGTSNLLNDHPLALVGLLAALVGLGVSVWKVSWLRERLMGLLDAIPTLRQLKEESMRARTNRILAALLGGGTTLYAALEQTASGISVSGRSALSKSRELIAAGMRPSQAFVETGLASDVESQLIASGERGGQLGAVLSRIADMQEQSVLRRADSLTALYSPLLMFVVAIVVALVVVALYWPMIDVFDSVK